MMTVISPHIRGVHQSGWNVLFALLSNATSAGYLSVMQAYFFPLKSDLVASREAGCSFQCNERLSDKCLFYFEVNQVTVQLPLSSLYTLLYLLHK